MTIQHKKQFGVYLWDTFDNETILLTANWDTGENAEFDTLQEAINFVNERFKDRITEKGADQVDIVDSHGRIVKCYSVC